MNFEFHMLHHYSVSCSWERVFPSGLPGLVIFRQSRDDFVRLVSAKIPGYFLAPMGANDCANFRLFPTPKVPQREFA